MGNRAGQGGRLGQARQGKAEQSRAEQRAQGRSSVVGGIGLDGGWRARGKRADWRLESEVERALRLAINGRCDDGGKPSDER